MRYLTCIAPGIQLNEECRLQMLKGIYQQQRPAVRVPSKVTKSFVIRVFPRKNKSLMCSCCAKSIHDLQRDSGGNWAGGAKQGVLFTRLMVLFYTNQVQRASKTNMSNDNSLERLFMLCQKISDDEFKQPPTKEVQRLETQFSFQAYCH